MAESEWMWFVLWQVNATGAWYIKGPLLNNEAAASHARAMAAENPHVKFFVVETTQVAKGLERPVEFRAVSKEVTHES